MEQVPRSADQGGTGWHSAVKPIKCCRRALEFVVRMGDDGCPVSWIHASRTAMVPNSRGCV